MESEATYTAKLIRDGVSQAQRLPQALSPDYVKIDERTEEDFCQFAEEFAKLVQYYDLENKVKQDATWQAFFDKTRQKTSNPHFALYLTFVHMLQYAQRDVNLLTGKHLNFYYQDVLHLFPKPARPDQVHTVFTLARHEDTHVLEKGALLQAGKDADDMPVYFTTDEDLVVNQTQIAALRSFFLSLAPPTDDGKVPGLYAAPVANSLDGLGQVDLPEGSPSWPGFGETQPVNPGKDDEYSSAEQAQIGFAIASPLLRLSEGERTVTLNLTFSDNPASALDATSFKACLTTAKGWLEIDTLDSVTTAGKVVTLEFTLDIEQPAITDYTEKAHQNLMATDYPVLKILCHKDTASATYASLEGLTVASAELTVDVSGMTNLVIQNEQSKEDPAKPFRVFGTSPKIGSAFLIGHQEVFSKRLTQLRLHFNWVDMPDPYYPVAPIPAEGNGGLEEEIEKYPPTNRWDKHYYEYPGVVGNLTNSSFTYVPELLYQKNWHGLRISSATLFSGAQGEEFTLTLGNGNSQLPVQVPVGSSYERDDTPQEFNAYGVNLQRGFVRIRLASPNSPIKAFGHKEYPQVYATQITNLANKVEGAALPKEPYTPVGSGLELGYRSSVTITTTKQEQFFHLEPFGQAPRTLKDQPLLPDYSEGDAYFYIGLSGLKPPQNLAMLFQVKDGSASPGVNPGDIQWSYLTEGLSWQNFDDKEVLADSTFDLKRSGIIKFQVPKAAAADTTLMGAPGTYWIRGRLTENPNSVNRLVGVHTQAVRATFSPRNNSNARLAEAMPAESISKLLPKRAAIKAVKQPYASFGGSMREEDASYYTRVSERLRHKNRAITLWDYERLVLEAFPGVYKVKCLPHTALERIEGLAYPVEQPLRPGHVTMVVVSNLRNQNGVDLFEPTTSLTTLSEIKSYLLGLNTVFLRDETVESGNNTPALTKEYLHVSNPIFEKIQVDFKVAFRPGVDQGEYTNQLNLDIIRFLSPWAFDEGEDLIFNGRIHRSMILNFVEELWYVDFVTCFKMFHYRLIQDRTDCDSITQSMDEPGGDVEQANASVQGAILVSHAAHGIHVITDPSAEGACDCDEEVTSGHLNNPIDREAVIAALALQPRKVQEDISWDQVFQLEKKLNEKNQKEGDV